MALTYEDRLAIQDLYSRYNAFIDTGDYEAWSRTFAEDGIFAGSSELKGRAKIAAFGKMRWEERPALEWANAQHWNNNLVVEGDGRSAKGLCYILRIAKHKHTGKFEIITHGMYTDDLVKVAGEWLFAKRSVLMDTPPASAVPRPA
jgi:hypothetical protein